MKMLGKKVTCLGLPMRRREINEYYFHKLHKVTARGFPRGNNSIEMVKNNNLKKENSAYRNKSFRSRFSVLDSRR